MPAPSIVISLTDYVCLLTSIKAKSHGKKNRAKEKDEVLPRIESMPLFHLVSEDSKHGHLALFSLSLNPCLSAFQFVSRYPSKELAFPEGM